MQFVAASKLKRAQDATLAVAAVREKIDEVLADLATVLGGEDHPLLAQREGGKRLIVLITTDRRPGRARSTRTSSGSPRSEIIEQPGDLALVTVGRKGRDAMRRAGVPIEAHFDGFGDRPTFADVLPLARLVTDDFLAGDVRPGRRRLQPLRLDAHPAARRSTSCCRSSRPSDTEGIPGNQFIFEPSPAAVLEQLLPRYVATRLYQAVLEAKAQRGVEPDGRDEERDRERRGPHRGPDPVLQQGPPGQHHPRDDRDRDRRADAR